jgi:hypothetical protein
VFSENLGFSDKSENADMTDDRVIIDLTIDPIDFSISSFEELLEEKRSFSVSWAETF